MDLATSLDHVLLDPLTEKKFQALKILHAKKIKSLMISIDSQQKEIGKLKILSKDNRRTQMIQSLKKKLKDAEYINDVLKDELCQKCEIERENINQFVIRKTISGPKRYRPLTREELELQIVELEKKLKKNKDTTATVSGGPSQTQTPSAPSRKPSATGNNGTNGTTSSRANLSNGDGKDDTEYLSKISELQESLYESQQLCNRRENLITQLNEEITRLRSVNSELLVLEEERDAIERQYNDLTLRHDQVVEELEDALQQVGSYQEESFQIKAECELEVESYVTEIDILREQYEKSLKQNTQLLKNMSELENLIGKKSSLPSVSSAPGAGAGTGGESFGSSQSLQEKLRVANQRIQQLENQLHVTVNTSNETVNEILILKSSLREKNNVIRDMKRNMNVVSKALQSTSTSTTSPQRPRPTSSSGGGVGGDGEASALLSSTRISEGSLKRRNESTSSPSPSPLEMLLGKFINSLLSYQLLLSSPQAASGPAATAIKNRLFKLLTELIDLFSQGGRGATRGAGARTETQIGLQVETLQKFEHHLLSKHPDIGMEEEDGEEEELEGMRIGK
jgi:DNA repair exonuclease SbcCD ATPase subunit